jgi:hypothetical protein
MFLLGEWKNLTVAAAVDGATSTHERISRANVDFDPKPVSDT